jgi:exopolysaccharide production protein ExoZ
VARILRNEEGDRIIGGPAGHRTMHYLTGSREKALASVQALRAVAALAVAIAHLPKVASITTASSYGAIGVDLFFVISGFIMVYTTTDSFGQPAAGWAFMARRTARIVPTYWLATGLAAWFWFQTGQQHLVTPPSVLSSLFFIPIGSGMPINGVGWTLNYEVFFYCLFAFALRLDRPRALLALTALFGALAIAHRLAALPAPLSYWSDPIIFEFVFGMWLAQARHNGVRIAPTALFGLLLGAIALVGLGGWLGYYARSLEDTPFPRSLAWGVPAAMVVAALVLGRTDWKPRSALGRLFCSVGNASYELYLFHFLVIHFVVTRIWPSLVKPGFAAAHPVVAAWVELLTTLCILIPVSIILHKLIARFIERPTKAALLRFATPRADVVSR